MGSTATTFNAFLKNNYDKEMVEWLLNKERPFQAKLTKNERSGLQLIIPVGIGRPQGLASDFANSQTAATQTSGGNVLGRQWIVQWGDYSGDVQIGDKVMAMSRDNIGAYFEDKKVEIDQLYEAFGDTMETYLLGDTGHSLTPGTFTISSGVCTCLQPDDVVFVEKGMILNASANDGTSSGHTLLGSGSAGYVIATNSGAGTFTVSTTSGGTAGTPASWTGTMYAFRQGDFGGASATLSIQGLNTWVPPSDPSATAFNNIDRTENMSALSGTRLTSTEVAGIGLEKRVKMLATRNVGRNKAPGFTDIIMNPEAWQTLNDSLESRGIRNLDDQKAGGFGYETIRMVVGGKRINVWSNRYCRKDRFFGVNFESMALYHVDGFPKVINGDGLEMLRKTDSNTYEHRIQTYPAFVVRWPMWNGNGAVPS